MWPFLICLIISAWHQWVCQWQSHDINDTSHSSKQRHQWHEPMLPSLKQRLACELRNILEAAHFQVIDHHLKKIRLGEHSAKSTQCQVTWQHTLPSLPNRQHKTLPASEKSVLLGPTPYPTMTMGSDGRKRRVTGQCRDRNVLSRMSMS